MNYEGCFIASSDTPIGKEVMDAIDKSLVLNTFAVVSPYVSLQLRQIADILDNQDWDLVTEHNGVKLIPVLSGMNLVGIVVDGSEHGLSAMYMPILYPADATMDRILSTVGLSGE